MSIAVMASVEQHLAFLGLDGVALVGHSAEFEIDRFDHWGDESAPSVRFTACMGGSFKTDDPSLQAA
ncbi:hypothetical protein [Actinokineospora sp. NPDC004072]